jgi:hypothetical protein
MKLKVDSEFKDILPALTDAEFMGLERSILKEGCRDAIITWNGTIVDGHARYAICSKHNIPYKTKEKQFDSRSDVCIWIIQNQLGRKNLDQNEQEKLIELRKNGIEN